jgi:protein arginine N-methyltransferase 2
MSLKFEQQNLIFIDTAITVEDNTGNSHRNQEVMGSWEDPLMKRHAEVACENGGDILEIGFGMGISADYIQQQNPDSHTIIESHPQVIEKLKVWAEDKPNIIIVEGHWYDVTGSLGIYDGIFYDTFGDKKLSEFKDACEQLTKSGSIITFWNHYGVMERSNAYGFVDNVSYEEVEVEDPYSSGAKYYLPKVVV